MNKREHGPVNERRGWPVDHAGWPWHVERGGGDCPFAVVKDSDGSRAGCHPSREAANKQMAALYASERTHEGAPMNELERRYTPVPVELRTSGDSLRIGGYAAVFERESENLGGFVERVAAVAFNKWRGMGWPDVMARYNHDDNMLLGTTGGNTLALRVDNTGLDYEVDLPKARSDIGELVGRGDVRKSSFAFRIASTDGDEWTMSDQSYPLRTLLSVQLIDVAPVNKPAYPDSTAGLRSLAVHMDADLAEVRKLAEENELRKFFVRTDGPAAVKPLSLVEARRRVTDHLGADI